VVWEDVESIHVLEGNKGLMVETRSPDAFYGRLPQLSLEDGNGIREVYSDDDNLEAVFKYLVKQ
jgi:ABC-2 type transport system ATP-binding protein